MATISARTPFKMRPKPKWSTQLTKIWVCHYRHSRRSVDGLSIDLDGNLFAFRHHHQQFGAPFKTGLRRRLPQKAAFAMYLSLKQRKMI